MVPVPINDLSRLLALYGHEVLDTPADPALDRLTRLAARSFGVPIAMVSLVDASRQWFKSTHGIETKETPRDISFCGHAILGTDVLVIPDARRDPRFAENPLVLGEPHIRFYAGAPLVDEEGFCLGALCLVDRKARPPLDAEEEEVLRDFAEMAMLRMTHGQRDRLPPAELSDAVERRADRRSLAVELAQLEVMATLAHELRNPLNALIGFSDLLRSEVDGPLGSKTYVEYADIVHTSGQHLLGLTSKTLDLARIGLGQIEMQEAAIPLDPLVQEVFSLFDLAARETDVSLRRRVPRDLPLLIADRQYLNQMLSNLVSNSIKYAPGGLVEVRARATAAGGLTLAVVDNGLGISDGQKALALRPFGRIDNRVTRRHQGAGLGLSLVKRLAELHGARLSIHGRPGGGTRVTLSFPADRVVDGSDSKGKAAALRRLRASAQRSKTAA